MRPNAPGSSKTAWEQVAVNPLVPLGVAGGVRLLVLGLEDADHLALRVARKVAAGAALCDHARVRALADGCPHAVDNGLELGLSNDGGWHVDRVGGAGCRPRQSLGCRRPHALGRLEHGVVDLEAALVLLAALLLVALELVGNLVGPALEARVDGFEVNTRVGASPAVVVLLVGRSPAVAAGAHATNRLWLLAAATSNGCIAGIRFGCSGKGGSRGGRLQ